MDASANNSTGKFSIVAGGPFHTALRRLGLVGTDLLPSQRAAIGLALIVWLLSDDGQREFTAILSSADRRSGSALAEVIIGQLVERQALCTTGSISVVCRIVNMKIEAATDKSQRTVVEQGQSRPGESIWRFIGQSNMAWCPMGCERIDG